MNFTQKLTNESTMRIAQCHPRPPPRGVRVSATNDDFKRMHHHSAHVYLHTVPRTLIYKYANTKPSDRRRLTITHA
ncbi:hypothetical protein VTI74DRAFT_6442 [Chaetomium olivicolor]